AVQNDEKGVGNGFPDGTSNTILFGQRYQVCNGTPCGWGYDTLYYWAPMFGYYSTQKFQIAPGATECNPALAQSFNNERVRVAMADGVVRSLAHHLDPITWYRALMPDDGLVNGNDFDD